MELIGPTSRWRCATVSGYSSRVRIWTSLLLFVCANVLFIASTAAPARADWECARGGMSGGAVRIEVLASAGSNYRAGRADCRCGVPLTLQVATRDGAAVFAGAPQVQASCQGGTCGAPTVAKDGAAVLVPLSGVACDAPAPVVVTVRDARTGATVTCTAPLAEAFRKPSFAPLSGLLVRVESGKLTLLIPRQDKPPAAAALQVLCRAAPPSVLPARIDESRAVFSTCRERGLLLRGTGQMMAEEVPAVAQDLAAAIADLGDGGPADLAPDQATPDLIPPADLSPAQPDSAGPRPAGVWDDSEPDPAFLCSEALSSVASRQDVTLSGLSNGTSYEFMVVASDARGNAAQVGLTRGTPVAGALPPLDISGCGCSVGGRAPQGRGAGLWALALLAGAPCLRRLRRHRVRRAAWSVLPAALILGPAGAAQAAPIGLQFNLKFGAYAPNLDGTQGLMMQRYSDLLLTSGQVPGEGLRRRLVSHLELDYLPLRGRFGQLGLGLSAGYAAISGSAFRAFLKADGSALTCTRDRDGTLRLEAEAADEQTCTGGGEATLKVVPLALFLLYRLDALDRRLGVPLIPYLKAGLGYDLFFWSGAEIRSASGASAGLVALPGLALNLGALDPRAQSALQRDFGIDRVTLFLEFSYHWINGFGATPTMGAGGTRTRLDLSELGFNAGLGVEL